MQEVGSEQKAHNGPESRYHYRAQTICTQFRGFISIGCITIFLAFLFPGISHAATTPMLAGQYSASCPTPGDVSNQSLLVVLLDRSGSLIIEPGATDPNGYSR